jgi:hypothetical protein
MAGPPLRVLVNRDVGERFHTLLDCFRLFLQRGKLFRDVARGVDLERRLKIFGAAHRGIARTIRLHGIPFRAVPEEAAS